MPWFYDLYEKIQFLDKVVTFTHCGKEYSVKAQNKGNTIPLINSDAAKKVIQKPLFAYIIHVKDSPSPCVNDNFVHDNVSTHINVHDDNDVAHRLRLNEFLNT